MLPAGPRQLNAVQNALAFTATAVLSAQTNAATSSVTVNCTTAAYVAIGNSGIVAAAANGAYLNAGVPQDFQISPGSYLSAVQVTAAGTLNIIEWK